MPLANKTEELVVGKLWIGFFKFHLLLGSVISIFLPFCCVRVTFCKPSLARSGVSLNSRMHIVSRYGVHDGISERSTSRINVVFCVFWDKDPLLPSV